MAPKRSPKVTYLTLHPMVTNFPCFQKGSKTAFKTAAVKVEPEVPNKPNERFCHCNDMVMCVMIGCFHHADGSRRTGAWGRRNSA